MKILDETLYTEKRIVGFKKKIKAALSDEVFNECDEYDNNDYAWLTYALLELAVEYSDKFTKVKDDGFITDALAEVISIFCEIPLRITSDEEDRCIKYQLARLEPSAD